LQQSEHFEHLETLKKKQLLTLNPSVVKITYRSICASRNVSYYTHHTVLKINDEIRTEQDKATVYFEVLSQELPERRGMRKIMKILNPVSL
jgi:hypothetical protein